MKSTLEQFEDVRKRERALLMMIFKKIVSEDAYQEFCKEGERLISDKPFIHDLEAHNLDLDKKGYLPLRIRDADDPVELGFVIQKKTLDGLILDPEKVVSASITPGTNPARAITYSLPDLPVQHVFYATEEGIERKLNNNANRFKNINHKELFLPILTELYAQFLVYTLQKVPRKFISTLVNYEAVNEEEMNQNDVDTIPPNKLDINSLPPEYTQAISPQNHIQTNSLPPGYMQSAGTVSIEDNRKEILQKYAKELRMKHEIYKYAISAQVLEACGMDTNKYLPEGLAAPIFFLKSNSPVKFVENITGWPDNRYFEKGLREFSKQAQDLPIRKVKDIEVGF